MQKVYNNPNNPSVFSGLDVRDFPWDRIEGAILRWGRPPPPGMDHQTRADLTGQLPVVIL